MCVWAMAVVVVWEGGKAGAGVSVPYVIFVNSEHVLLVCVLQSHRVQSRNVGAGLLCYSSYSYSAHAYGTTR